MTTETSFTWFVTVSLLGTPRWAWLLCQDTDTDIWPEQRRIQCQYSSLERRYPWTRGRLLWTADDRWWGCTSLSQHHSNSHCWWWQYVNAKLLAMYGLTNQISLFPASSLN